MKVDFETLGAVIAFLTSAAGVGGLLALLDDADFKELLKNLGSLVKNDRADRNLTQRNTRKLGWRLFTGILILHIVNLGVYASLLVVLVIGPDHLPATLWVANPATPFTSLEKILYTTWLVISLLVYLFRCILPTINSFSLYSKALKWLRGHPDNG
jgi:hypothetical protein